MKVVVLADNQGESLQPLTSALSFLRLELLGEPLLFYILDSLLGLPVSEIIIIANYNISEIQLLFPENEYKGMNVSLVCVDTAVVTAESVKNVANEDDDTLLVINADSYFEFNLSEAYSRHIINKNDVTIICKNVDDPRDYAVINETEEGKISEIVEKPDWSGVFSDLVDCGVYFIEHSVWELEKENKSDRNLRSVFLDAINSNLKVCSFKSTEYWCNINDTNAFKKVQFDLLSGKATKKIPFVASDIFTKTSVPSGNFVIVPPVFFGDNVQVESGAVIGPFAVIGEGSLIAKGSKISDSILSKSVYVSSKCSVTGAILGESVSVKKGALILEGAVIGKECLIGEESVIGEGVSVWHNKTIENGVFINENVKYSKPEAKVALVNDVIYGDFGVELTPEKTARLGAALGTLLGGLRVGVGVDGELNSIALKYALLSGLISVGAKTFDFGNCFYSQMFYYSAFCDVDIAVFISGGENGVSLSFCEKGGMALSRENIHKLEEILTSGEFNRTTGADCHNVSVVESLCKMYENEIVRQFEDIRMGFKGVLFCSGNPLVDICVKSILKRISLNEENEDFIVKINNTGTRLTVVEKNQNFSHEKILAVVAFYEMKKGNDVVLLWDAPQIITTLASELGRKALRLSDYSNSDFNKIKSVNIDKLWSADGVFLLFRLVKILFEENKSLKELVEEIPEFYVAKKVMTIESLPSLVSKELLKKDFKTDSGGGVTRKTKKGVVRVRNDNNGKSLKIITEAVTTELAEELCGEIEKLISIDIDT